MQCIMDSLPQYSILGYLHFVGRCMLSLSCYSTALILPSNQRIPLTKICSRKHLRCEPWLPQAENGQGKKIFKVRKKSGNFTSSQGKFKSLKEVKEKWNFKTLWGERWVYYHAGLICAIGNLVVQRNFTFVRKKSGNFINLWLWQPCQSSSGQPCCFVWHSVIIFSSDLRRI